MEQNRKLVAVSYDKQNKCEKVLPILNLTETEYKKYLNEQAAHEEEKLNKENDKQEKLLGFIKEKINGKDLFIAKSIYDSFVSHGFILYDEKFELDFYNFVLNGYPLDSKCFPEDFKKVLEKVGKANEKVY